MFASNWHQRIIHGVQGTHRGRVQFYLEDLLGCEIDLVTERALRAQFRPYVERDAIPIV